MQGQNDTEQKYKSTTQVLMALTAHNSINFINPGQLHDIILFCICYSLSFSKNLHFPTEQLCNSSAQMIFIQGFSIQIFN